MNRKFKVALLYYKDRNLGDIVIHDTAKYLITDILNKKNIDFEIESYDIGNKYLDSIKITKRREKLNEARQKYIKFLKKVDSKLFNNKEKILIENWKLSKYYLFIKNRVIKKFNNVDLIVFAGGGLIKYHQQDFHYIINDITKFANKKRIPVIFNAVGVEGYDENRTECMILKNAINRKCVKFFSTRDDINLLNDKYIYRNIPTYLVADSAVWTKETYKVKKKKSNIIGIGVIRPNIFEKYLYSVKEETLLKMFSQTIRKLKKLGYEVKLFTNGAISDQKFIEQLKDYMKLGKSFDKMVETRPEKAQELIDLISGYDIVLGTRLHSNIISYSLGIPTVSIVWNNKQLMFAKINGIEEFFITKENFNADYIVEKILKSKKQKKIDNKKYKQTVYNFLETAITSIIDK